MKKLDLKKFKLNDIEFELSFDNLTDCDVNLEEFNEFIILKIKLYYSIFGVLPNKNVNFYFDPEVYNISEVTLFDNFIILYVDKIKVQ